MIYRFLLFILLGFGQTLLAQKLVQKSVVAPHISKIAIDASACFEVHLKSAPQNEVEVYAKIDGEYSPDLVATIAKSGTTLFVNAGFSPTFIDPNDKLSAHKVVSISLTILVPNSIEIAVDGTSANVMASGSYRDLHITLNDGFCSLAEVYGKINVKTQKGTISLASDAAQVSASSKYGKVSQDKIPIGITQVTLRSITGNIHITKLE